MMKARMLVLPALMLVAAPAVRAQAAQQTPALGARGPPAACYSDLGSPQRCIPEFENAAFGVLMEATNTCGDSGDIRYCTQTGVSMRKSCDTCSGGQFQSYFLTDLHHEQENQTWWQSETMNEGIQFPNQVNLTLHLGKAFDITYVRLVFYSPRPESFAIYKRTNQDGNWEPYQYYSATCRETYELPDTTSALRGAETRALCTSEYSDISPLKGGNVAFSTLEGRPTAFSFDTSSELQVWVTATDIRITLDRLNTFGDEMFRDQQVLQSYWYAIADVAVGARCKCNGHASKCDFVYEGGARRRVCQCEHNTAGPDCDRCLDFYNDAPWGRASQHHVHECKPCNCNGYSNRCYFDQDLFNKTGHGGHCLDCLDNRDGPNCEKCKLNYFLRSDNICVPCDCNPTGSRSLQCNSGGKCQCKPGVTGDKCDQCAANHYEFTSAGCKSCGCNEAGSFNNVPHCDPNTGICQCKEHVEGKRCRECKPGFFNLDHENDFGCTPCFCYGHSAECQIAPGYSKTTIESNFPRNYEKWSAQDERRKAVGLQYISANQNIAVSSVSNEPIFFVAPKQYLGDQRASYNHDLKFTLRRNGEENGYPPSSDVILEGAGTYVATPIFSQDNGVPGIRNKEFVFRLHEHPNYGWSPKISARAFMSILSNLTSIRIRGTYGNQGTGYLDNVRLESAQRGGAGRPAHWLEMCSCPTGYVGQFCESCAPGYRHSPARGGPFKPCVPCDCNSHADICDSETGRCICKHNTYGDNCGRCARGYYGNALAGTPYDCNQCPCPNNGPCIQMADSNLVCTECPTGYSGMKCDLCSDGYYGDPTGLFGPVQICKPCDCNLNIDLNAVGNCNRTTGECLKCIYNTAGEHCDQCLPGHFGNALAARKGDCKRCMCDGAGALRTDGIPRCDPFNGVCECADHVTGDSCNSCEEGFFDLSPTGCRNCECNLEGSKNKLCHPITGDCNCKPGVTGSKCDVCMAYQYGFSSEGCKECMCDRIGSKSLHCDPTGQCPCFDNVEGRQCDRCKENKHDRQKGCVDCPDCYNLVQDAVQIHRGKLQNLQQKLRDIERNPTVISSSDFDIDLQKVKDELNTLSDKAKEGSGATKDGKSLSNRLEDLNNRLEDIQKLLDKVDKSTSDAHDFAEDGSENITVSKELIEASRKELDNALDYLNEDGAAALAKAQNRSEQFGQQSTQMSGIAQESRLITERLKKEADNINQIAETAYNRSSEAYQLAKEGLGQQSKISIELRALAGEINAAKGKLGTVQSMATQSLGKSVAAYEDAVEIFTKVDLTAIPKIDTEKIRADASFMQSNAQEIQNEVDKLLSDNSKMLENLGDQIKESKNLLERGSNQQMKVEEQLEKLDQIHTQAKQAVNQGNATLEEAQNIYNTLKQFHDKVRNSHEEADNALQKLPAIDELIKKSNSMNTVVQRDLELVADNAREARDTAQEAHDVFALQASKEAFAIKTKASAMLVDAGMLDDEAKQLSGRVYETQRQIDTRVTASEDNDQLTKDAKAKVGQAKNDTAQVEKIVHKALNEVNTITKELASLPDLQDHSLDTLARHLEEAEKELKRANLSGHIQMLHDVRNTHQKWLKDYEQEAKVLKLQVENVKNILDALPNDCFKRVKLEP